MVNRETLQGAFDLVELFRERMISSVIAGGAARDIYFGVKPKDVDVIVAGTDMETVSNILQVAGIVSVPFFIYNGIKSDRLIGGFKLVGSSIDICVYDVAESADAIAAFDFNLNQFCIVNIHKGIDEASVRWCGVHHWSKGLQPVREDYSKDRHDKMQVKWLDLSWRRPLGETPEVPVGGLNGPF